MCVYIQVYVYVYIYTYTHACVYICIVCKYTLKLFAFIYIDTNM